MGGFRVSLCSHIKNVMPIAIRPIFLKFVGGKFMERINGFNEHHSEVV